LEHEQESGGFCIIVNEAKNFRKYTPITFAHSDVVCCYASDCAVCKLQLIQKTQVTNLGAEKTTATFNFKWNHHLLQNLEKFCL